MKLIITGGHAAPALACTDYILSKYPEVKIVYIGRKFIQKTDTATSYEFQEVTKRNLPFFHLDAGRFTRILSFRSFLHLLKIPIGFWNAWNILQKEKPDLILSFGGYLAVPVAVVGAMEGVPVYTHEQTMHPGLANTIISKVAKNVFVSFAETLKDFHQNKVVLTGNPIREEVFKVIKKPEALSQLTSQLANQPTSSSRPIIYITGGSLGAHSINEHVQKILPQLLQKYSIIHQIGNIKEYDDFNNLVEFKKKLEPALAEHYFPVTHFLADEVGYVFSLADMVIGRAGANTFFEIMALRKPVVFIPLPWSGHGEQQKHAEIAAKAGVGEIFDQYHDSQELLALIEKIMSNITTYQHHFAELPTQYVNPTAVQSIVDSVLQN